MIEDKLSFCSNHSETHSDIGERLEYVAECSPIKDDSTKDQFKRRVVFLERLLMTHLDSNSNTQTWMQQDINDLKQKISGLN